MRDIIITTYLTGGVDTQRGQSWSEADFEDKIKVLAESCRNHNIPLIVLIDFDHTKPMPGIETVRVDKTDVNPYFQRWINIYDYLSIHEDVDKVFHLDATDTEVFKNPFQEVEDKKLYVGSEPIKTNNDWIVKNHTYTLMDALLFLHGHKQLLNAGVIGGNRFPLMTFCYQVKDSFKRHGDDYTDIPIINWVIRDIELFASGTIITGSNINTKFKGYDYKNTSKSWFRHK